MNGRPLSVFFSRILWGAAVWLAGCTDPVERTQVVVVIDAEESLRARIRYVEVEVRSGSADAEVWELKLSTTLMPRRAGEGWPLDLRLARPQDGSGYLVTATAKSADDSTLTVVRALSEYVQGRTLELRLRFDEACATRMVACPKTFSCAAGSCIDPFIPPEALAPPNEPVAERGNEPAMMPATRPMPNEPMGGAGGCSGASCRISSACEPGDRDCMPACAIRDDKGVCQVCPSGFLGSAADGCSPALSSLRVLEGALEPAFDPAETAYRVSLPLLTEKATLQIKAADTVELLVNGAPVAAGADWTTALELGDNDVSITLNAVGHASRTYRLMLQRSGMQVQQLKAAETKPGDSFGVGLAVSNDRLVIGAPYEDGGEPDSGAAYVFERTPEGWQERAYLKAEVPRSGAHFGHSVAIDGDRLAVAAPEDAGGGAIYVFERSGETWMRVATLREVPGSLLGRGLALQRDRLAAGAPGGMASDRGTGSVYLYSRDATGWKRSSNLVLKDAAARDYTGSSVALDGDTLITGATGRQLPGQALWSGAVFAFQREGDSWRELPMLAPTQVELGAFFGEATALVGDRVAVGGFFSNVGLTGGTAYVFQRGADGVFTEEAVLRPNNTRGGDWFGARVAITGDILVVGASEESSGVGGVGAPGTGTVEKSGAVYLFERGRSGWRQLVEIKSETPVAEEEFGRNLAVSGDELFVSAPSDIPRNGKSPGSGSVYVFR